jgi:hypothetical protein
MSYVCQKCGFKSESEIEAREHYDDNPTHFVDKR